MEPMRALVNTPMHYECSCEHTHTTSTETQFFISHIYIHIYVHMYICIYVSVWICIYIWVYVWVYSYIWVYVCVCVCIHICVYIYVLALSFEKLILTCCSYSDKRSFCSHFPMWIESLYTFFSYSNIRNKLHTFLEFIIFWPLMFLLDKVLEKDGISGTWCMPISGFSKTKPSMNFLRSSDREEKVTWVTTLRMLFI